MENRKLNIAVVYGSVRSARQGIKAAKFIEMKISERGHEVELVDACEVDLPMLDKMYKEFGPGEAPENMKKIAKIFEKADAYVIVSAEYNHGVPGALKNLLDHYQKEYLFKPSGIVTYSAGPWGGVRVAIHLRDILAELGMPSIPTSLSIPRVQDAFDDEGKAIDDSYSRRVGKFLDELEWYSRALRAERGNGAPY
jgi:NAD(P)H-dependent FMN reductase